MNGTIIEEQDLKEVRKLLNEALRVETKNVYIKNRLTKIKQILKL
jgi:hypothetical protein